MKILIVLLCCSIYLNAQWFNKETLRCVVLFEKEINGKLEPHGTGFLIYDYKNKYKTFLITCAHLVKNHNNIYIAIPAKNESKKRIPEPIFIGVIQDSSSIWKFEKGMLRIRLKLEENGKKNYVTNDILDIAAIKISIPYALFKSERITSPGPVSFPRSLIKTKEELRLGDEVYFIGFPFGIGSETFEPLIRSGSIAWKNYQNYLLDAFSYGGNSGSPIFTKSSKKENPMLIGMITSHLTDKVPRVVTVPDTSLKKIVFKDIESNIGLAKCVWMDDILKLINTFTDKSN